MVSAVKPNPAVQTAQAALACKAIYLDTETTGLYESAEIVEICLVDHGGEVLLESLVKPRRPIPPDVVGIHGITNAMVSGAPAWPEVWPAVAEIITGRQVAIYNAPFDLRMMQQSHSAHGCPWKMPDADFLCVMRLYAAFRGGGWQSLAAAGAQCGIKLRNVHRARADALMARALLRYMAGLKR